MRLFFHRASAVCGIASVCMIPIGILVEANHWGQMPDRFVLGFFLYAIFFYFINHMTSPRVEK